MAGLGRSASGGRAGPGPRNCWPWKGNDKGCRGMAWALEQIVTARAQTDTERSGRNWVQGPSQPEVGSQGQVSQLGPGLQRPSGQCWTKKEINLGPTGPGKKPVPAVPSCPAPSLPHPSSLWVFGPFILCIHGNILSICPERWCQHHGRDRGQDYVLLVPSPVSSVCRDSVSAC